MLCTVLVFHVHDRQAGAGAEKDHEALFPLMSFLLHAIGGAWCVIRSKSKAERGCVYCILTLQGWRG